MQLPYPEICGGQWMAQVHVFCDESGKVHQSDYISFCGFLGLNEQWRKLMDLWRVLRFEFNVPPIHVSAMLHPTEKNGWRDVQERWGEDWPLKFEEILNHFSGAIYESGIVAVGAVLDAKAFRDMALPELKRDLYDDPHYFEFSVTVMRCLKLINWQETNATLGLLLDDDNEKALNCYHLLRSLKEHSQEARERVSGICFVNDAVYPGVQAADMLAHEARRLMTAKLPPSQRFFNMTRKLQYQINLFDAKKLQEMEEELLASPKEEDV